MVFFLFWASAAPTHRMQAPNIHTPTCPALPLAAVGRPLHVRTPTCPALPLAAVGSPRLRSSSMTSSDTFFGMRGKMVSK